MDSRFKTADSYSDAQFKFELKESVQLPDKCVVFVDDLVIPHSWYNVEENNKYAYVRRFRNWNCESKCKQNTIFRNSKPYIR